MRMLADFSPEFTELLDKMDDLYAEKRTIDEKTYPFIWFARQLTGFRDSVLRQRLGHDFSEELSRIYDMLNEVETILESKK